MKKIIIFLVTVLFTLSANAQMYLYVVSQLKHLGSVASKDVVNDNDGNPCAKIMFEMSVNDVTFSSPNLVGDSSKKTGRYECFVSVSQKQGTEIEIKHPKRIMSKLMQRYMNPITESLQKNYHFMMIMTNRSILIVPRYPKYHFLTQNM